ncbi:tripartite tricarboxylate transporter substrate binding protein [Rhodovarius crocodyli]|uniref:Tripartite tricarboxylate transporter substrate binding protein n=1 Tax=Rhodovarius crocodyli TaxID=1979269 RepID=A0A437MGK0_9PROT|nr:tripartite tricarboxylate transporter substrate binding protein [Rhodovarius crocodyli]RVT96742.1 tripartite tricarboxylate transporter substrate binding protein [Rhodovarius crocodyli]
MSEWMSRPARRTVLQALAGTALSAPAFAQAYPARPVTLVAPMAAGGSTDYAARLLAQRLTEAFGVPMVVENRPGATGSIGANYVARANPDGYTLLLGNSSVVVVNPLTSQVTYDMARDFRPVGMLATVETILVASRKSGIRSLPDLIARAKASPGRLSYGSNGQGSAFHLAGEFLSLTAEIELLHVPYRGASEAEAALLSGDIDAAITNTVSVIPHIREGLVTPLAIISTAEPSLPGVPRGSSVLPGYVVDTWVGLYAPRATQDGPVQRLNEALNTFLRAPANAEAMRARGLEPAPGTVEEAIRFQDAERAKWARVVDFVRAGGRLN